MGKEKLAIGDFVHLHNHTHHSLLDGLTKIPKLIDRVQGMGMKAVAMTDHGTMSGAIDFYINAINSEVKPIIGMETYIAKRKHTDKDPAYDKPNFHLTLIAMNNSGYQNLMKLSTIANLEGFYYKARIDRDLLEKYNEGLIVLSGCIGGELGDALRNDQDKQAEDIAKWYKKIFGDRYYFEVQDHGHEKHPNKWDEQAKVTKKTLKLAKKLEIPCVVTCDAHYLDAEDKEAHEILLCVQTGSFLSDENRMSLKNFDLHLTDPRELISRWGDDYPELIKNSGLIADRCSVQLDLGKILIPKFELEKGVSEKEYLSQEVYKGIAVRYGRLSKKEAAKLTKKQIEKTVSAEIIKRAEYELGVIDSMGFNGYFLIIADFINWGKKQGIVFGPGRGSAAGSIISYSLNITELDPLKYDLLFERFLNPERISMPDIDIDIQDTRRDEVIQYCVAKYGKERVANIVTFGTMAARNAVRDVARVLQVPYSDADRLAKMIPPPIQGRHIPLINSLNDDADLKNEYENNKTSKEVFDLAVKLEGTIRSHGVHAAGVVIAPDDIVKFTPLEMAQKGVIATQYPMNPIEELGLLKMDFLGLSNLTIIKNALRIIKKVHHKEIDLTDLPLDDKKTYELLGRGDTTGVFQFESAGMKRYLRQLKPNVFEDIVAMGALYRPGPLTAGLTDKFINRKNGLEKVVYDHPLMEKALGSTYGVLVYQEQVMRIAVDMCGFSGGQADTLRKAIGKKKLDLMAKMKTEFIEGMIKNSDVSRKFADDFWKSLEGFADYAFNKSHSACYGLISYQTAYLKAHFPNAFMAALMTSDYDDTDRLAIEIKECQHVGIEVLPPDVNESFLEFAVVPNKNQIRFGLNAIKNVGTAAAEEIIRARESVNGFENLEDFLEHVNSRVVNKKSIESLIKSGGFDKFGDRQVLLDNIEQILAFSSKLQKETDTGQIDIFGAAGQDIPKMKPKLNFEKSNTETSPQQKLVWERELLGLYLSEHPLDMYKSILEEQSIPIKSLTNEMNGKTVTIGGIINSSKEVTTKNGQKMAFAELSDEEREIEIVVFPKTYAQSIGNWERDNVVIVKGKVNVDDKFGGENELKIMANEMRIITEQQAKAYKPTGKKKASPTSIRKKPSETKELNHDRLYIRVKDSSNTELLKDLKKILDQKPGNSEVVLVVGGIDDKKAIKLPEKFDISQQVTNRLMDLVGAENIKTGK